jgi:hypothetical protein
MHDLKYELVEYASLILRLFTLYQISLPIIYDQKLLLSIIMLAVLPYFRWRIRSK